MFMVIFYYREELRGVWEGFKFRVFGYFFLGVYGWLIFLVKMYDDTYGVGIFLL